MRNRTIRRVALAVAAAAVAMVSLGGCFDKQTEQFQDAGRTKTENTAPAEVIPMPDGFSNAAFKCNGTDGVYVAFHGDDKYAALAVVPNDKNCTK